MRESRPFFSAACTLSVHNFAQIDEQASNQSQGAQKAAKARVKAIKRALPPLALSEGRGLLIGYDEYGIDDE